METRFLLGLFFCASTGVHIANAGTREYRIRVQEAMSKCQKEFGIDGSVVREFLDKAITPESEEGKCLIACYLEELELMKAGTVDIEHMKQENAMKWSDPENVALANQVTDRCQEKVMSGVGSKCDIAANYMNCMVEHGDEVGLPQGDD